MGTALVGIRDTGTTPHPVEDTGADNMSKDKSSRDESPPPGDRRDPSDPANKDAIKDHIRDKTQDSRVGDGTGDGGGSDSGNWDLVGPG